MKEELGKFYVGPDMYLKIINISKKHMWCTPHSTLGYRIIGNIQCPDAIDPSGGPFIEKEIYRINDFTLKDINYTTNNYVLLFER